MIDSNCGYFNKDGKATFDTVVSLEVGETLLVKANFSEVDATQYFIGNTENNGGVRYNGTNFLVYSGSGGTIRTVAYAVPDAIIELKVVKTSSIDYDLYVDNVFIGTSGNGALNIEALGSRPNGSFAFKGHMTYFEIIGKVQVNFTEGGLDVLYNTGIEGGDLTISDTNLAVFWGQSQDVYHYNYASGFDLWENGTVGEEIRVPIGKTVTQAGYTFTASFPAKVGLNNCESEIDFDVTLGFAHDPLAYSEFQQNFDGGNEVYSCVKDGDHKNIRFYSPALTTAQNTKLINCYNKKGC